MNLHVRLVCAALLALGMVLLGWPVRAASAQDQQRCFAQGTLCVKGRLLAFWAANGGEAAFGPPITEQHVEIIEGRAYQVQWFERARLELHPENPAPYDVLLGRLGIERLQQEGRNWHAFAKSASGAGCRYFAATRHAVCSPFLAGWLARGIESDGKPGYARAENMASLGLPLSEAYGEMIDGKPLLVQWFERGRLAMRDAVYDGSLGSEVYTHQVPLPSVAARGHIVYLAPDGVSVKRADPDGQNIHTLFTISKPVTETVDTLSANSAGTAFVYVTSNNGFEQRYTAVANGRATPLDKFAGKPRWSPDGSTVAMQRYSDTQKAYVAVLFNVRTRAVTELPFHGTPDWFADGKRLVYVVGFPRANDLVRIEIRSYDLRTRTGRLLEEFIGTDQDGWSIIEAHVLPSERQIIFYGDKQRHISAVGNGFSWWWIPINGGTPQSFHMSGGNFFMIYAASPNNKWLATASLFHNSACSTGGAALLRAADLHSDIQLYAPLPQQRGDAHTEFEIYVKGLGWEPNSNYLVVGAHSYECTSAGNEPQNEADAIYVWNIQHIGTKSETFNKILDGSLPNWVR